MPKLITKPAFKTEEVKSLSPLRRICYWIVERESIRLQKEMNKPKPWTQDPILQAYRFCNVRRMDDKVSMWLMTHWYVPYKDHPNILPACVIARLFNKPESLAKLTHLVFTESKPDVDVIKRTMQTLRTKGNPIFNGAYIVSTNGLEGDKVEVIMERIARQVIDRPIDIRPNSPTAMEETVTALTSYWGISTFIAGQVTADLRHAMTGKWADKNTYAPIGPGSRRGMNRLLDRPVDSRMNQTDFGFHLAWYMQEAKKLLPTTITSRLEAQDYQNSLCEYDKFCRCLFGEGKPKQRYPGAS